jgi:hypothetical protein
MPIASGLYTQVGFKAEGAFATAPGQSGGQLLRRVQCTLDLEKDTYESNEVRPDMQVADFRHGPRRVSGKLDGELSAGTYAPFFAAALKRDFTAVSALTGLSLTIQYSGGVWQVNRSAGDFIAAGIKHGMVVQISGPGLSIANLSKNLLVYTVTTNSLYVIPLNGVSLVAEGPVTSLTLTVIGKRTYVPQTGHLDRSFGFERWYADIAQSELYLGVKPTKLSIGLPATGLCSFSMDMLGQDMADTAADRGGVAMTTQYFTSPGALTTSTALAAVNGVLYAGGAGGAVANITGMSLDIACPYSGGPVVASNVSPALFASPVIVTGQVTAYFDSVALRDAFINETEVELYAAFTSSSAPNADFIAFGLSRVKLGGASKSDGGSGGIVQTLPYRALMYAYTNAAAIERTTMVIQDSQA